MKLSKEIVADGVIMHLVGELDTPSIIEIQPEVDQILEMADQKITIDCSKLTYIASSGLRQIISIHKKAMLAGGSVSIVGLTPEVYEIFAVTNLDKILNIK